MRKWLLIASVASLAVPSIAAAQPGCRAEQHDNRVAGTFVGAGLGALIGSAVAGPGSRGAGAVIGAVGGGVVGNAAGGSSVNCGDSRGGYYDDNHVWHVAAGYYDDNGRWVDGARPYPGPDGARSADTYSADVAYVGRPSDLTGREDWLEQRIQRGEDARAISHYDADGDRGRLSSIREMQGRLRDDHDGLTADDRGDLSARLDDLSASLNAQWGSGD